MIENEYFLLDETNSADIKIIKDAIERGREMLDAPKRPYNWPSEELVAYIGKRYKVDFLSLNDLQMRDLFRYLETMPKKLGEKKIVINTQESFNL